MRSAYPPWVCVIALLKQHGIEPSTAGTKCFQQALHTMGHFWMALQAGLQRDLGGTTPWLDEAVQAWDQLPQASRPEASTRVWLSGSGGWSSAVQTVRTVGPGGVYVDRAEDLELCFLAASGALPWPTGPIPDISHRTEQFELTINTRAWNDSVACLFM